MLQQPAPSSIIIEEMNAKDSTPLGSAPALSVAAEGAGRRSTQALMLISAWKMRSATTMSRKGNRKPSRLQVLKH